MGASAKPASTADLTTGPRVMITALGITQILAWGSSYYLPAGPGSPLITSADQSSAARRILASESETHTPSTRFSREPVIRSSKQPG
jgi:hypothetical protein